MPPALKAQFFYTAVRSIDHPPESGEKAILIPRPFQGHDNDQLEEAWRGKQHVDITIGNARLYFVEFPSLLMKPIYWTPVAQDVAVVTRGTWFYKNTMLPLDPEVANQLEKGYRELRPWSQTWNDELNSALEVGPAGEEKIVHRLWEPESDERNLEIAGSPSASGGHVASLETFYGEAAAHGVLTEDEPSAGATKTIVRPFPHAQVIYGDAQNAYVLKPSLQPSVSAGRRPLYKIKKAGVAVGIHCVRGFDWKVWKKLYPSNSKIQPTTPAQITAVQERPETTDLILVIHGIGQKLSERVESFTFTHAITSFRNSVWSQLAQKPIKGVLRPDLGGMMVLPVNWRSNLSFDAGGPKKEGDKTSDYTISDIMPQTIPEIRNAISDVALDIPFYMSQHKPKMISAVISEANRVYRLWCKNNPEFHKNGRVHIIAHSLGSAMALEILGKQPTTVPEVDLVSKTINSTFFDFNTTNLFFVGSPAGFFLLLDKGNLVPRRDRNKPGIEEGADEDPSVVGKQGTFGCLAIDNIYNVMHRYDAVATRLNGTVDSEFAASLKAAEVPGDNNSWFLGSIVSAVKTMTPGVVAPVGVPFGQLPPRPSGLARLPSQVEMGVHDFTREEVAEKKFYLLNDNGQIDWVLAEGKRSPFPYYEMLGAHSSYWGNSDFARMVVVECGRRSGREYALPNMRVVKHARRL